LGDNGVDFKKTLAIFSFGEGRIICGIETVVLSKIEDTYHLTYTMVSSNGVGVGLRTTSTGKHLRKKE
jgi:predicted GH43/DUF377 family glycosyl hydrolase